MDALAFRPSEAAKLVGLSRTKLYELLRKQEIAHVKVGSVTLIRADDLRAWLAAQANSTGGA